MSLTLWLLKVKNDSSNKYIPGGPHNSGKSTNSISRNQRRQNGLTSANRNQTRSQSFCTHCNYLVILLRPIINCMAIHLGLNTSQNLHKVILKTRMRVTFQPAMTILISQVQH